MDHAFWLDKWTQGQIGFHEADTHPLLAAHWPALGVPPGTRVFVPLCGKSLDMVWLRERGHAIVGVELSALACAAFFEERGLEPAVTHTGGFDVYEAGGYRLLCGDCFSLGAELVGGVAAVYDRAALIALPASLRPDYVARLAGLTGPGVPMLLVTLGYAPDIVNPPPYSIGADAVRALYAPCFEIDTLETIDSTVKGEPCTETAFRLTRRAD